MGADGQRWEGILQKDLAKAQTDSNACAAGVFEHMFGFVSDGLAAKEKRHFASVLTAYRGSRVPVGAVTTLLRSWVERFDVRYLADQVLFEPYPGEMVMLLDSGKGREA